MAGTISTTQEAEAANKGANAVASNSSANGASDIISGSFDCRENHQNQQRQAMGVQLVEGGAAVAQGIDQSNKHMNMFIPELNDEALNSHAKASLVYSPQGCLQLDIRSPHAHGSQNEGNIGLSP